ncbi:unnamed protein product [Ectocarpus sp. 8 AP-2014]
MIFIYVVVWQVWFYSWGFYALGQDDELERKLAGEATKSPSEATTDDVEISSPCEIAQGDALPPRQAEGGSGRQSPIHDGAVVVGAISRRNEGVSGTGRTAAASHAGKDGDDEGCCSWAGLRRRLWRLVVSPNMIAVAIGVTIAMIPALQELLFDNPRAVLRPLGAAIETIGSPTVAVSTLVMAGSLVQVPTVGVASAAATQGVQGDDDSTLRRWRRFRILVGFLHVVCRLIVVPAVGFTLFWVARNQSSVMGENRLMHLILLIELAMPSAAFVIVSLNQLRMPATAGFMARLYLWQYGASMLTITAWTALAVHLVY